MRLCQWSVYVHQMTELKWTNVWIHYVFCICSLIIIIIICGFGIYGAAVVPDSGVGNTWQCLTLFLHEFLSNGLTPSRLHIVISFLTHADHVFLGLPRSLVPGSPNRVMELMHEVVCCTCPYHLRRRVRRIAVISSRSSFWRSTAEEISSSMLLIIIDNGFRWLSRCELIKIY